MIRKNFEEQKSPTNWLSLLEYFVYHSRIYNKHTDSKWKKLFSTEWKRAL